jgi:hypothetical protein
MAKKSESHTQHERALEDPKTRELLDKLVAEWNDLNLDERGVRLEPLHSAGCSDHGLGKALNADPKTIGRCRHIAELPAEQRAQIAKGASATRFLQAQQNLQKRAEAARTDPRETQNSQTPNAGKSILESRPDPVVDTKLQAHQRQIETLTNSVQQLEKRVHELEVYQEIILSNFKEDADAAAAAEECSSDSKWPRAMLKNYQRVVEKTKIQFHKSRLW